MNTNEPAALSRNFVDSLAPLVLPPWWIAGQERFDALVSARSRIHEHERRAMKRAESVIAASLLAVASLYSVDATGAVNIPVASGFLVLFVAVAFPVTVAWLLDRRMLQQLNDINLRSRLWVDLLDNVRYGRIDVLQLTFCPFDETEVERLLRREAAIAARFLASPSTAAPHLPIFGHCFTLEARR